MDLDTRVVLLTGAGSGIGRATALELARRGAVLLLVGRRSDELRVTAELIEAGGGAAHVVAGDVTSPADRARWIDVAETELGGLDILINNAGNVRAGRLERIDESDLRSQLEVNLIAPILLTREALPGLRRAVSTRGAAAIVNVSSGIALVGIPFYATYAAAKAGIARFGEALRRELVGEGVHVLTVYPGATETPMMASHRGTPELGFRRETPEAVAQALADGLAHDALEVVRGGEVRLAMIAANRERPLELDQRFAVTKADLERAVSDHRRM
jgi:uncharacterized oxidoreductase